MAEVIGVVSGLIDIFSFFASMFPSPESNVAYLRVTAALDTDSLHEAGGAIYDIDLYNENEQYIGGWNDDHVTINNGDFYDFACDQDNNQQATWVTVEADTDAICIPSLSLTMAGGDKYGWVGDWGQQCNLQWYYSNYYVDNSDR